MALAQRGLAGLRGRRRESCSPACSSTRTRWSTAMRGDGALSLGRSPSVPVLRHRAVLPPRLPRPPGRRVAAGARRRGRQARAGRQGRRRRLRPRRLDGHHGAGLPEVPLPRLRLPRPLDRDGAPARERSRRRRPRPTFAQATAKRLPGQRLRPGLLLRLPARHGRPGRRGPPRASGAEADGGTVLLVEPFASDQLDENLNPVGPAVLRGVDLICTPNSLSQEVGLGLGRAGRRGAAARGLPRRRLRQLPPRDRDAVQPGLEARK